MWISELAKLLQNVISYYSRPQSKTSLELQFFKKETFNFSLLKITEILAVGYFKYQNDTSPWYNTQYQNEPETQSTAWCSTLTTWYFFTASQYGQTTFKVTKHYWPWDFDTINCDILLWHETWRHCVAVISLLPWQVNPGDSSGGGGLICSLLLACGAPSGFTFIP